MGGLPAVWARGGRRGCVEGMCGGDKRARAGCADRRTCRRGRCGARSYKQTTIFGLCALTFSVSSTLSGILGHPIAVVRLRFSRQMRVERDFSRLADAPMHRRWQTRAQRHARRSRIPFTRDASSEMATRVAQWAPSCFSVARAPINLPGSNLHESRRPSMQPDAISLALHIWDKHSHQL